jgi:hypothetical protein
LPRGAGVSEVLSLRVERAGRLSARGWLAAGRGREGAGGRGAGRTGLVCAGLAGAGLGWTGGGALATGGLLGLGLGLGATRGLGCGRGGGGLTTATSLGFLGTSLMFTRAGALVAFPAAPEAIMACSRSGKKSACKSREAARHSQRRFFTSRLRRWQWRSWRCQARAVDPWR